MPDKRKHEATKSDKKPRKVWQQDPANQLSPFTPGIFITCVRGKEQIASKDALDLLKDYADRHGLQEQQEQQAVPELAPENQTDDTEADIESSIAAELGTMQDRKPRKEALFTALKTLTECVIFIRTAKHVDPVKVVHDICSEAHANPNQKNGGRFLRRMTPITISADSSLGGLKHCLENILPKEFAGEGLKYKIEPTFRNHNVLNRDVVIPEVATAISASGSHTVDLKNYDVLVMVEVIRGYLGISVVRDWEKLRKFNLSEIYSSALTEA